MSLEELRENNKRCVLEQALVCFTEKGIEETKVADIARRVGITERSVYRYYATKAELVLKVADLFWERHNRRIEEYIARAGIGRLSGIEQVRRVMGLYAEAYHQDRGMLVFAQEAEMLLYKNGLDKGVIHEPPVNFSDFSAPLSRAIRAGLADGTVRRDIDVETAYKNAYAGLLGMMQKMALDSHDTDAENERDRHRLDEFCDMVTEYLSVKGR